MSPTFDAIPPNTSPAITNAIIQPNSAPRCSRQARASGLRSPAAPRAGPGRSGSRPAPMSRRATNANAPSVNNAAKASGSNRIAQRSPANGRTWADQLSGDSQENQDG